MWKILLGIVKECANSHCPMVKVNIPNNSPVWFTRELVEEINHKDFLYVEAKRLGTDEAWAEFKRKKKEVTKILHNAKETYIKEQIDSQQNNPRKFWRNINSISGIGKTGKKASLTKIFDSENGTVLENQHAPDYMNDYYVNAGPTLAEKFDDKWNELDYNINTNSTFKFDFVTEDQILKLIKNIDIGKSSAIDNLSSRILKDSLEMLTLEFTQLYNECLIQGYFPIEWTLGTVGPTPMPKVNINNKEQKNWRPISQIQLPGIFLERVVHTQLVKYFSENNFLNENQHGF